MPDNAPENITAVPEFLHLLPAKQFPGTITNKARIITLYLKGWFRSTTREPEITVTSLSVGSSHKILPETPHLVVNGGDGDCRFLLLQGVGALDWIAAD
jgi:hypothetical protein